MTTRNTVLSLSLFLVACGGAPAVHNGYPAGENEPWTSAKKLKLNDNLESSAEGSVSFPQRERARWYVLELPAPGAITARLNMDPRTTGADVGFEVLDSGFNVNAQAQNDDDIGQEKKVREVKEARAGKTYFHVFALGRTDQADYKLRIKYDPKQTLTPRQAPPPSDGGEPRSAIPNLPPLAQVPAADDTPRSGGKRVVRETDDRPPPTPLPVEPDDPAKDAPVRATITEFSKSGTLVKITLNKGSDSGIEEGWTGYIMDTATKRSLPKGAFKIKSVRSDESEGTAGCTLDDVQRNRTVYLKPPK